MDFDLTRKDSEEARRSSVRQLRRTRTTQPPVLDDGDDWNTRNADSLTVPTPKPAAIPPAVELPTERADAFNLELPEPAVRPHAPVRPISPATSPPDRAPAQRRPIADPEPGGAPADIQTIAEDHEPPRAPVALPTPSATRSRPIRFPAGASLASRKTLLLRLTERKQVLIGACVAVLVALSATALYNALSPTTTRAISHNAVKESAASITHSSAVGHSTTKTDAFVKNPKSRTPRDRGSAHRSRGAAVHHRSRTAARHTTTRTPTRATNSVAPIEHAYTAPAAAPATSSGTEATSSGTTPASTSSRTTKTPAFGASGALGPGSSPDG